MSPQSQPLPLQPRTHAAGRNLELVETPELLEAKEAVLDLVNGVGALAAEENELDNIIK